MKIILPVIPTAKYQEPRLIGFDLQQNTPRAGRSGAGFSTAGALNGSRSSPRALPAASAFRVQPCHVLNEIRGRRRLRYRTLEPAHIWTDSTAPGNGSIFGMPSILTNPPP